MVNIKQLIKDKGISQVELSRLLNEHTSVVSLLVNGKRELTEAHLARLVEIFGEEVISQYDGLTDYEVAEKDVMVNIKGIITDFNLTQTDIAKIMGEPQSVISTLANGKRKQTRQHIDALIAHFGQEVIDKYTLPADAYEPKVRDAKVTIIDSEIIEEAKELGREEVRKQMGSDVLAIQCENAHKGKCPATMPFVSNDIVQSRDIDIRNLVEKSPNELEQFTLSKVFKGVDYIQKVITEAMEPYYFPGDYLLVHFMPAQGDILSGATYLVDTKVYGAMLRKVYVCENGYTLKPHNPEFDEVFISRENVYSISIVVSMFRTNTNLTLASNLSTLV
ncbi:MAG: LexA family transcriptional regulator, partial [Alistipes sp.]|nr:LexA family transcriptional regulator [Alistipes sp.]